MGTEGHCDGEALQRLDSEITRRETEPSDLATARTAVVARLEELRRTRAALLPGRLLGALFPHAPVTKESPPSEKLAFFGRLFRGREDVYPRRWESAKTGRSGYQPACGYGPGSGLEAGDGEEARRVAPV